MKRRTHRLGFLFLALGAGLIGLCLWAVADHYFYREQVTPELERETRNVRDGRLVQVAEASRHEAESNGLIGRIEIPRLGLSELVLEGTTGRALRRGVGHVEHTAFPGERGNAALAAHRDTYFRPLRHLQKDDLIRIDTPDGRFSYRVDSILIVTPDREDLLEPTDQPRLTLVTCYPFYYVGPAPRRYIVLARPDAGPGSAAAAQGGPLVTLDTSR